MAQLTEKTYFTRCDTAKFRKHIIKSFRVYFATQVSDTDVSTIKLPLNFNRISIYPL